MKVYAVIENWDNGEEYEDRSNGSSAIAIAASEELAKEQIELRKLDLYAKANKSGEEYTVRELNEVEGWEKGICGLRFDAGMCSDIFSTYSCGTDIFWWEIQEFELIES